MSAKEAYAEYLKTDKWKTIRSQRLAMDNGECVLCGEKAEHVHHRRYPKEWGTETVRDLVSLCGSCHGKHHNEQSGEIEIPDPDSVKGKFLVTYDGVTLNEQETLLAFNLSKNISEYVSEVTDNGFIFSELNQMQTEIFSMRKRLEHLENKTKGA